MANTITLKGTLPIPPTEILRQAAQGVPLMIIKVGMLGQLQEELGSMNKAVAWLYELAGEIGHPLGVNVAEPGTNGERSVTNFMAPKGWTVERLKGWIGVYGAQIEEELGTVTSLEEDDHG